jgi:hypothetical protein
MPYRPEDGFSWETVDHPIETRRIVAALVLLVAGWGVGFFAGRMSAWVFPVAQSNAAAVAAVQSPPRSVPAQPSQGKQAVAAPSTAARTESPPDAPQSGKSAPPAASTTASATTATSEPAKTPAATEDRQSEPEPSATAQAPAGQGFALVNPNWKQHRRTQQREASLTGRAYDDDGNDRADGRRGSEAAMIACERRYSSFRRSDGTYQPYGRGSREVCPLLR